jgi:hypothetical protein
LRHLLLPLAFGLGLWGIYPRAKAAWVLHDAATALADYARCMAGPTGPGAVRESSDGFRKLLRRRLLSAQPTDRPFAACGSLAQELVPGPTTERAHAAEAAQFAEYNDVALAAGDDKEGFTLAAVGIGASVLDPLSAAAWPFERNGYRHLIESSSTAKEASHPQELPLPAAGAGFPRKGSLYRPTWFAGGRWLAASGSQSTMSVVESSDFGVTWGATSLNQPAIGDYAGRCAQFGSSNSFTVERTESGFAVQSWSTEQVLSRAQLAAGLEVTRTACDSSVLLLVVSAKQKALPGVLACEHGRACTPLNLDVAWLAADFDVAQIEGVSVVLTTGNGVTRVRSSRDRGASWTPGIVAYDAEQAGAPVSSAPTQLVVMGRRLMLYGQAAPRQAYPVLYSDDFGASFHGLETASAAPRRAGGTPIARRP